jgi:hypothetical protein
MEKSKIEVLVKIHEDRMKKYEKIRNLKLKKYKYKMKTLANFSNESEELSSLEVYHLSLIEVTKKIRKEEEKMISYKIKLKKQ